MAVQATTVVTRDVEDRYRGFLTSVMLEIAPGVYVSPQMSQGVRDRVWSVLTDWWSALGNGSVVMTWRDVKAIGNLQIRTLGTPPKEIVDADGILLVKRKRHCANTLPFLFETVGNHIDGQERLPRVPGDRPPRRRDLHRGRRAPPGARG
jgi:CRISPR-associated protein Cas2